jgi:hypothetical protein
LLRAAQVPGSPSIGRYPTLFGQSVVAGFQSAGRNLEPKSRHRALIILMKSLIHQSHGMNMSRFISRSSRLLLTLCLGLPAALPSYSQAGNADEQTFVKLQHDWAEARKKGDVAFLERFMQRNSRSAPRTARSPRERRILRCSPRGDAGQTHKLDA